MDNEALLIHMEELFGALETRLDAKFDQKFNQEFAVQRTHMEESLGALETRLDTKFDQKFNRQFPMQRKHIEKMLTQFAVGITGQIDGLRLEISRVKVELQSIRDVIEPMEGKVLVHDQRLDRHRNRIAALEEEWAVRGD